ncbi:putative leucine-rich repeat domain, L domain-containing protein [Medicago truncatula]|nr:SCF E3 ubiquitin ligase complex F-box protein grrA [Medicago truncatula]RHN68621.1 putative leucine-rich repeat domain, L domain-containing protein [Medicago truncatula]
MTFIADSFPLLEELDISFPKGISGDDYYYNYNNALKVFLTRLSELRKVNLSGNSYVNDSLFFQLCMNCKFLKEVVMYKCRSITHAGIASAIYQRPTLSSLSLTNFKEAREIENVTLYFIDSLHLDLQCAKFLNDQHFNELCAFLGDLVSINVSGCDDLTNSAFFALLRNCPLLTEIRMESTNIGVSSIPSMDLVEYHQVKSLHLAHNSGLQDEHIKRFALMFPSMQFLDLYACRYISEKAISKVLNRCCKFRHLNFAFYPQPKLFLINFEVSKLEVLNLSNSRIDDGALYAISKSCPRLLHLDLEDCHHVTEKGVRLVLDNCVHLREINLQYCPKVFADTVAKMILLRPSLRKIMTPPRFRL